MRGHRHTSDGRKVVAVLAGDPDSVVENLGAVLVTLENGAHAEGWSGDFVVEVNGGMMPEGSERRRFRDPMAAFDCAVAIARDLFGAWVHGEGLEFPPQPITRDAGGRRIREVLGKGPAEQDADLTPLTWHTPLCDGGACDWCDARREQLGKMAEAGELGPDPLGDHHGRNE